MRTLRALSVAAAQLKRVVHRVTLAGCCGKPDERQHPNAVDKSTRRRGCGARRRRRWRRALGAPLVCCTPSSVCLSSIIEHLLVGLLAKAGSSKPKRRRQTDLASNGAAHHVQMSHNSEDTRRSTHATHRAATTVQRDSYSRTLCVHTPKGTTVSHYLFVGSRFACLPWSAPLQLGLRPPLSFQLPGVAPPELLLRSIPQPSRP